MPLKSILIHVERGGESRVKLALELAKRHQANLIGVAADFWMPSIAAGGYDAGVSADLVRSVQEDIERSLKTLRENFQTWTEHKGVPVEWRSSLAFPEPMLVSALAAADLVVLGTLEASHKAAIYQAVNPGDVIMSAGRPVLVIPPQVESISARNIVVGWKNTRESRRAVSDAMPFLTMAESVLLVHVTETSAETESVRDTESLLAHHGVAVQSRIVSSTKRAAHEELLGIASDVGADLIVTGAYGRTRLREWAFGGVTRGLLTESHLGCLFSH